MTSKTTGKYLLEWLKGISNYLRTIVLDVFTSIRGWGYPTLYALGCV